MAEEGIRRLAELAAFLNERVDVSRRLEQLIDPLVGYRIVAGERQLTVRLANLVVASRSALDRLKTADDDQGVQSSLDELSDSLKDVDWDIAQETAGMLQAEISNQARELQTWRDKLAEWQVRLDALTRLLGAALEEGVHLRLEEDTRAQLDSRMAAIRQAITEKNYTLIRSLIDETTNRISAAFPDENWDDIIPRLQQKIDTAKVFASQADLLLLKSGGQQWVEYTVLLRTASRPGSHGVNIQGSSTVFERDRRNFNDKVDLITSAINQGLIRALSASPDGATPANELAEPEKLIRRMGELLYRLVIPDEMQGYLQGNHCSLTITSNDLELPWELMYDGNEFLCLQRPVGRMPMGYRFPRGLDHRSVRPVQKRILFIADPSGNLEGARKEIATIQDALKRDERGATLEVRVLEGKDVTTENINDQLLSGELDMIHYCGHANFEENRPEMSALLLNQDELCNAQKIRRLLEGHPLVFLNACRSGRAANEQQKQTSTDYVLRGPAEGLASAFIYGGALGCVGAMWPVYDTPAADFAIEFYRGVLRGEMIGEALRKARIESRKQHPSSITWASFVLYGDPIFRLLS